MTTRKPLTHARQADTAKAEEKSYKLNAGDGLFLEITPSGSKRWRLRYFFAGKEQMLSLGLYPSIGLLEAKEARDDARKLISKGIDPSEHRKEEKIASKTTTQNSFEAIANEWLAQQTDKADVTRAKAKWLLQFAIAEFGQVPIHEVTPPMVLAACRKEESAGKLETARRIRSKCSQVFRYAVGTSRIERDPTTDLRGLIKPPVVTHRSAITDPKKVGQLLRDIDNYNGRFSTLCALKIAPLVFIRPGELRSARWDDIDLDSGMWRYTPPKTRNQTQLQHIIPLSTQAVAILRQLHMLTRNNPFVFQSTGKEGHLSEAAILGALRRMGYEKDEMSGHGFRAMARTILDEVLGFRVEWIEQQLAHKVSDMHGRAYNRTKHLTERTRMMQEWSDYLDRLKCGEVIAPPNKRA
ncbi:MAG: integrase arm-type DNA-binding domain-containing protein [Agitococcus sp.]|nr:integrase arm-type DNA-binding domain-containing protein [Agitococcus sp.]